MRMAIACVFLLVTTIPSIAATGPLLATYSIRWAGIEVARLGVDVHLGQHDYRARWDGATTGLVGTLFPFVASGEVEGRIEGVELSPEHYRGRSTWGDGGSIWRVEFDPDGRASEIEIERDDLGPRDPVPAPLRVGPDPVTLALTALARAEPGTRIEGRSFDGRRVLGYDFACDDPPMVQAGETTLTCLVSAELVAGGTQRWRESRRGDAEPIRVWLRAEPGSARYLPVRAETVSRFGTVTAELVAIERPPRSG